MIQQPARISSLQIRSLGRVSAVQEFNPVPGLWRRLLCLSCRYPVCNLLGNLDVGMVVNFSLVPQLLGHDELIRIHLATKQ